MRNLFTVLFFCCLSSLSLAQSDYRAGYIVNLQGDTLKGQVNYKGDVNNALECNFKANETAEPKTYKPTELKGYGFAGGKFYEAKKAIIVNRKLNLINQFDVIPVASNDSVNFMQVLIKGTTSLFYMKDATSAPHYFLQKNNGPVSELIYLQATMTDPKTYKTYPYKSKLYVGVLRNALQDCPTLSARIDKTEFKESELQDLIYDYNTCVAPTKSILTQKKAKSVVTKGVMGGVSFSNLAIVIEQHFLSAGDYNSKAAPTFGAFLDLTLPKLNEKLSINNALFYTNRNYTAQFDYAASDLSYTNYKISYNFSYVRLETSLRYTLQNRSLRPYFQVGLANNFMVKSIENISSIKYYLNYPPEQSEVTNYLTPVFRTHQLGGIGGLGVQHALSPKLNLFLQANYELNTGFTNSVSMSSYSHNAAILLGIGF